MWLIFPSLVHVFSLGRPESTAGVGFATIVLYVAISINIGLHAEKTRLGASSG